MKISRFTKNSFRCGTRETPAIIMPFYGPKGGGEHYERLSLTQAKALHASLSDAIAKHKEDETP